MAAKRKAQSLDHEHNNPADMMPLKKRDLGQASRQLRPKTTTPNAILKLPDELLLKICEMVYEPQRDHNSVLAKRMCRSALVRLGRTCRRFHARVQWMLYRNGPGRHEEFVKYLHTMIANPQIGQLTRTLRMEYTAAWTDSPRSQSSASVDLLHMTKRESTENMAKVKRHKPDERLAAITERDLVELPSYWEGDMELTAEGASGSAARGNEHHHAGSKRSCLVGTAVAGLGPRRPHGRAEHEVSFPYLTSIEIVLARVPEAQLFKHPPGLDLKPIDLTHLLSRAPSLENLSLEGGPFTCTTGSAVVKSSALITLDLFAWSGDGETLTALLLACTATTTTTNLKNFTINIYPERVPNHESTPASPAQVVDALALSSASSSLQNLLIIAHAAEHWNSNGWFDEAELEASFYRRISPFRFNPFSALEKLQIQANNLEWDTRKKQHPPHHCREMPSLRELIVFSIPKDLECSCLKSEFKVLGLLFSSSYPFSSWDEFASLIGTYSLGWHAEEFQRGKVKLWLGEGELNDSRRLHHHLLSSGEKNAVDWNDGVALVGRGIFEVLRDAQRLETAGYTSRWLRKAPIIPASPKAGLMLANKRGRAFLCVQSLIRIWNDPM
ncbi:hypothetical protein B0H66DRAFT_624421 [Apodospora peruviana]|uniref:F-box domain-containing protein n=1 Tax=Apodospora peruviana TaxID=516989 RepID=A0AAE0M1N5_9PEZI|nr:hypothetical protein B0H66DRAFT_624421 [Apodospora peruviana]